MSLFALICIVVFAAALLLETRHPEGVLVVPVGVWLALVGALGGWLLLHAAVG